MTVERSYKNGSKSFLGGMRQVFVKVIPLELCGQGNPQDDTMSSFFHDSKRSLLEIHLFNMIFRDFSPTTFPPFQISRAQLQARSYDSEGPH